jgi:hypothetical protein
VTEKGGYLMQIPNSIEEAIKEGVEVYCSSPLRTAKCEDVIGVYVRHFLAQNFTPPIIKRHQLPEVISAINALWEAVTRVSK